jgi:hypothetical protein
MAAVYIFNPISLDLLLDRCGADQTTSSVTIFGVGFFAKVKKCGGNGRMKAIDRVLLVGNGGITPYHKGRELDFQKDLREIVRVGNQRAYKLTVHPEEPNPYWSTTLRFFLNCTDFGNTPRKGYEPRNFDCELDLPPKAVEVFMEYVSIVVALGTLHGTIDS